MSLSLPLHRKKCFTNSCSTRSRTIRNRTSARVSVPSLLYKEETPSDPSKPWVWRTNLSATKPFWEDWFIGLSRKFLEARGGKLLLLAGTDRLDKELMIGQMQGTLSFSGCRSWLCSCSADLCQENINSRSSPKRAISSRRICRQRQPRFWWTFTNGMIGARLCFRQRWLICRLPLLCRRVRVLRLVLHICRSRR